MSCYCATKWGYLLIFIGWLTWGFVWLPTSKTAPPSPPSTFLYFAYGSNLLTERIHFQNPSATFKGVAKLDGYRLDFRLPTKVRVSKHVKKNLHSDRVLQRWNGCAATITESPEESVYGCLWELDMDHLQTLDNQEGVWKGFYERIKVEVWMNAHSMLFIFQ